MRVLLRSFGAMALAVVLAPPAFAQPAAPSFTVSVSGTTVSLAITPVAGVDTHRVQIGTYSGGADLLNTTLSATLTNPSGSVPAGGYFIRMASIAGGTQGAFSAEQTFTVGTPRPNAPTLSASLDGSVLTFNWAPAGAGGTPTSYILKVGRAFGSSDLASGINYGASDATASYNIGSILPTGTYFARLFARNATGTSDASDEVIFTVGSSLPGVPTPLEPIVSGNTVTFRWTAPVGGATPTSYVIEGAADPRGLGPITEVSALVDESPNSPRPSAAATLSWTYPGSVPSGGYYWRVRAKAGSVTGGVFGTSTLAVNLPEPPAGPRTPNPKPGTRLPIPSYASYVVGQVAAAYAGDLRNSCVEFGGNNTFMYKLVRELRKRDTRWGLNWKRGGIGDMSQDIVTYNYGTLPDEWPSPGTRTGTRGTTQVYIIDVIGGHCGSNPSAFFDDKTDVTINSGTIGMFTIYPYTAAGYAAASADVPDPQQ